MTTPAKYPHVPFFDLQNKIITLRDRMICNGNFATELWLGPTEAKILEHWFNEEAKMFNMRHHEEKAMKHGTGVEHAIFMGLTIRLMVSDGVRVGTSITQP